MTDSLAFMFLRIILATHNQNHGFEEGANCISLNPYWSAYVTPNQLFYSSCETFNTLPSVELISI